MCSIYSSGSPAPILAVIIESIRWIWTPAAFVTAEDNSYYSFELNVDMRTESARRLARKHSESFYLTESETFDLTEMKIRRSFEETE